MKYKDSNATSNRFGPRCDRQGSNKAKIEIETRKKDKWALGPYFNRSLRQVHD